MSSRWVPLHLEVGPLQGEWGVGGGGGRGSGGEQGGQSFFVVVVVSPAGGLKTKSGGGKAEGRGWGEGGAPDYLRYLQI